MKFVLVTVFLAIVAVATAASDDLPTCFCTRELAPVCASNGVTYSNRCEFNCAKEELLLRGISDPDLKITRGGDCNGPEIPEFTNELY